MQEPFMVPLWLFSCEAESSLREPPSIDVAMKLINNFHKNGFHTGAPVLLRVQASIFFTTVYFSKKKTTLSSFKFSHLSFPYRKAACLIVVPFQMVGSGSSREQPGFRLQWLWLWLLTVCLRRQGSLKIISMFG